MIDVIYKYMANRDGIYRVPKGDVVLVAYQDTTQPFPTVWVRHKPQAPLAVELQVYGTGFPIPEDWRSVGSAVCGHLVWHVVEEQA